MRQIGTLPRNLNPRVFSDHLLALGMKSRVDDQPAGYLVWIYDEDQLPQARQELEAFIADPANPRYAASAAGAEARRTAEARLDREYRKNFREISDQWSGLRLRSRPLTMALVFASVLVFLLDHSTPGNSVENALMITTVRRDPQRGLRDDGLDRIKAGQVWRLVTPIFLHFNILHILFNCWAITLEGTLIETRRGTWRLAVLVLASAVISNLGQYFYMDRANPEGLHLFGGLSGVSYALFGYLWMKGQYEPEQGMILHPNVVTTMLFWLVICMTGLMGPIANAAHVAGLLAGVAFGVLRF